jgi:hypothetical protein
MTITTEQAVALADAHGAIYYDDDGVRVMATRHIAAMLNDHEQQIRSDERKLIECRSSVKHDYNNWDRLVMRKQKEGSLNQCDTDEFNRVGDLLDYIDTIDAALKGQQ